VFNYGTADLFWGTGDCDNDGIYAGNISVPEPASLTLPGGQTARRSARLDRRFGLDECTGFRCPKIPVMSSHHTR